MLLSISFDFAFDKNDGGSNSPTQPQNGEDSVQVEFAPPKADYGGYNFRIYAYDGSIGNMQGILRISEAFSEEENGDPINDAIYRRNKETEALYNIEISVVPGDILDAQNFMQKFSTAVLTGDDLFDAAFINGPTVSGDISQFIYFRLYAK